MTDAEYQSALAEMEADDARSRQSILRNQQLNARFLPKGYEWTPFGVTNGMRDVIVFGELGEVVGTARKAIR